MKAMDVLLDADDLARFAHLETDEDAASFQRLTTGRDTGPDFAPATWWKYRATDSNGRPLAGKQWRFTQSLVREAWDQQFRSEVGLFDLARLLLSVFEPEALLENVIPSLSNAHRPRYADVGALAEEHGFHKAIRLLAGGPSWRMKKCENENCGRRFVADHNERRRCSTKCSSEYQAERQNKWGRKNNWGRPSTVKAKVRKSGPRVPGSRRKKAATKT
jgi:predicted RNA-binding Zn ribbon-like protein